LASPALTPTLAPKFFPVHLPAVSAGPAPLSPAAAAAELAGRLRGSEVILIQAAQAENGRRQGYDLSQKVEELIKRREGQVRGLQRDGPAEIFADTFAVEVRPEHMAEVLAELKALEGADVRSLSELIALGSRRAAPELPDAQTLQGYAARLKDGTLEARWTAFAELASMLETASPEALAALPPETRDALVFPLYGIAADAANAFNLVQGATRTDLRKSFLDAKANEEDGWGAVENGASAALKHPELQARFMPLRAHLSRTLAAIDRLGTEQARAVVRQVLPHADYAGLELISRPERAAAYARSWLAELENSIAEMKEGLLAPPPAEGEKENKWHGSNRSGGYTHVDGRRQSAHLYQWRPYRFDAAESRNELLLLLGIPSSGASLVGPMLDLLESFQSRWPELQELHKRKTLAREYKSAEGNLAYYKKQAEAEGRPYTPEQVEQIRAQLLEQANERYEQHDRLDGHSVIDRLLTSFGFHNSYAGAVPGFDEAAYIANVLSFLSGATQRLEERGLVAQLADGALHFLTSIADSSALKTRPELRAQAVSVWRALADKTAAIGIKLNTRLDGVIDPRPEKRVEPQALESVAGDATVWQLAPSPDGRFIAQATGDRRIRVWDAATRALVTTIELDDARQLYGDLANSLGVSWDGPRLRVTTLHDGEKDGKKVAYNLIRTYDLRTPQPVRNAIDAVREDIAMGVYVLRENSIGVGGPFYASPVELRNEQHHYLGAEVRLIAADGRELAKLEKAQLLDLKKDRLLSAAPGRSQAQLQLWDVADPAQPQDITPDWLRLKVAEWRQRNPPSEYGWWPSIEAKLGTYQGRPALLWADQGRLSILDLQTGAELRSLEIPSGWRLSPYLTNAAGTLLAAIVTAPGQFAGPNPERVIAWDLTTGELLMDHDATYVPTGWLYTRGQSIAHLDFSGDRRLIAAGRKGVQVFELP
ncbi:MAG: hypothetical protein AB1725_09750, partial [Armatimonadota bacterium]